ncbi:MAG: DUF512 domain-containing protein [Anaerolineae bacterium]|nr:DUF512 domain-containing protein [Anaerolineae bacterium]
MTRYFPAPIQSVASDSVAARAGILPGDVLLALNGLPVRDVIDVHLFASVPRLSFLLERNGRRIRLPARRRYGEPLGLEFAEELFDAPLRVCRNNCDFCFVAQMVPGLRSPLYVKDDDYRLSFLHGNYISLTNLASQDWERIIEQFLSPLYVSVHATIPEVRIGLMHNPRSGEIMTQLRRLVESGIQIHTQAVLVPGRNDGACLDRTIADLAGLYPGVRSLCVVPVGLTRWHNPALRPFTEAEATVTLEQTLAHQERLRQTLGIGFVYPSDEWFLRSGRPIPDLTAYDDLLPALVENGVGMVRLFMEEWIPTRTSLAAIGGAKQTWVTGTLFAPLLRNYAQDFQRVTGIVVEVIAVPNHAFGETVTVTGLLFGADILAVLGKADLGEVIIMPEVIFRGPGAQTLDGFSARALSESLGRPIHLWGAAVD